MIGRPALIVALGASNTAGYGVGEDRAYPAIIERLLRDRGWHLDVSNRGISGDTTGQMLARLDRSVPKGTRIVLFQPGSNDARLGIGDDQRQRNIDAITSALHERGITVLRVAAAFEAARIGNLQADGVHFTEAGHELVAQVLIGSVVEALNR
jgi:acyl-CoA thioesterase I